ncbi:hypothetical protein U8607_13585 [Methylobacterium durans]|uniref:hypothetical protein n=1 Tax=Methylobacterium durans TaxID=2202825 RepID=UPI002AFDEA23|nr:hypothetical protein [Methylobacterium durans]MEA1833113.1 hypothetical protein [Methylobacterium durans]
MFAIMMAALVGGPLTTALLWENGAVVALAAAPFGGSVSGLLVAWLVATLQARPEAAGRCAEPMPERLRNSW